MDDPLTLQRKDRVIYLDCISLLMHCNSKLLRSKKNISNIADESANYKILVH